jgi:hypothetical protein
MESYKKKRDEEMEEMLKKIQEHQDHIVKVSNLCFILFILKGLSHEIDFKHLRDSFDIIRMAVIMIRRVCYFLGLTDLDMLFVHLFESEYYRYSFLQSSSIILHYYLEKTGPSSFFACVFIVYYLQSISL